MDVDELFGRKVEVIRFIRLVADRIGLAEAKNLAEWFVAECPAHLINWRKLTTLVEIARGLEAGSLKFSSEELMEIHKMTVESLRIQEKIYITGAGDDVKIERIVPFQWPQY